MRRTGLPLAQPPEEGLEETLTFVLKESLHDLNLVVQPLVLEEVQYGAGPTRFGVGTPVHDTGDPRQHQRAGAHDTRLNRDVERGIRQPPSAQARPGLAKHQDLGMGRRVLPALPLVVGLGDHDAVHGQDGTDRDLAT